MKKNLKLTFKQLLLASMIALTGLSVPTSAYALSNATTQIMQTQQKAMPGFKVNNSFKLYVNGEKREIKNNYVVVNDRTFLPFREVANLLGISNDNIKWEQDTQVASLSNGSTYIEIPIGYTSASVNNKVKDIDTTDTTKSPTRSLLTKGVTYLPLRFLSENLGYKVSYKEATKTIHLYNTPTEPELVIQTTTSSGKYIHPFFAEKGGVVLDGFVPKDGNYGMCVDLNGDGKIGSRKGGYDASIFNNADQLSQYTAMAEEARDWFIKNNPAPSTTGNTGGEKSQDGNWEWNDYDNSWDFVGSDNFAQFNQDVADAIKESAKHSEDIGGIV